MDPHNSMSSTSGRASAISTPSDPSERSPNNFSQAMPRFPLRDRLSSPHSHSSSDLTFPEDYTSWSSLQMDSTKKQKASGDAPTVSKQPNSSYFSVDPTDLAMAEPSLIPAQRRRAQNRASQRAFRERKERHVKNLEQELEALHQQYKALLEAYSQQKQHILELEAELQELDPRNKAFQASQNSPLEPAPRIHARNYRSREDAMQPLQHGFLIPPSQSLTPASNLETRNSAPVSEENTPFGSLLPLTPAENFESPALFRLSDPLFAEPESTGCHSVGDYPDTQQQQQQGDFGSPPAFSKGFAINPSAHTFQGWR